MEEFNSIDLGELLGLITLAGSGIVGWVKLKTNIAKMEEKVENITDELKEEKQNNRDGFSKVESKLDRIMDYLMSNK